MTLLLPVLGFIFVSMLVAGTVLALSSGQGAVVERRLEEIAGAQSRAERSGTSYGRTLLGALRRIGEAAPQRASEIGKIQQRLLASGYRRHEALWIFLGLRVGVALACFAISTVPLVFRPSLAASLGADVAALLADTIGELCRGQVLELAHLFDVGRTEESYLSSVEGKTASLMATACRIGGMVSGVDDTTLDSLTRFGHHLGICFQVVDDVLDVTATEAELGKPDRKSTRLNSSH